MVTGSGDKQLTINRVIHKVDKTDVATVRSMCMKLAQEHTAYTDHHANHYRGLSLKRRHGDQRFMFSENNFAD